MDCKFTVVIPTLGVRPKELERAIKSVLGQDAGGAIPLVVVNGDRHDPDLVRHLRQRRDIRFHQISTPGVAGARYEGRKQVDTPYFGFLDDDDELLPNAMRVRLAVFAELAPDIVVTNGYLDMASKREILFTQFRNFPDDPARALMEENWLDGPGGLYRTDKVSCEIFLELPNFLEWTYLAFLLSQKHKIYRLDEPTFVRNMGATDQVSQSYRYYREVPLVLAAMERLTPRPELRTLLRQKRFSALHDCSSIAMQRHNMRDAWIYHLRSIAGIRGLLRYGLYTRHLLTLSPPRKD